MVKFRYSYIPLHLISKCVALDAFSIKSLRPSWIGTSISIGLWISYTTFHVYSAQTNLNQNDLNFISLIIDSYNRYSNLFCLCVIIIMANFQQKKLSAIHNQFEYVDEVCSKHLSLTINNIKWSL